MTDRHSITTEQLDRGMNALAMDLDLLKWRSDASTVYMGLTALLKGEGEDPAALWGELTTKALELGDRALALSARSENPVPGWLMKHAADLARRVRLAGEMTGVCP